MSGLTSCARMRSRKAWRAEARRLAPLSFYGAAPGRLGQSLHFCECRLLLHDGDAGFEVRRCDIGDQTRLEAVAQPLFESRNIAWNLIRSQHDLMTLGVKRVESVKEFLLGALAA